MICIELWDDIYNIFKWNSFENIRTYFKNFCSLNLLWVPFIWEAVKAELKNPGCYTQGFTVSQNGTGCLNNRLSFYLGQSSASWIENYNEWTSLRNSVPTTSCRLETLQWYKYSVKMQCQLWKGGNPMNC